MKILINLCAHDGIISHYTGVGTMVKRYIKTIAKILDDKKIDFELNLFTPEYNNDSFGYSDEVKELHQIYNIYKVSNGSDAKINYGTLTNWEKLCENTAKIINEIKISEFDKVITICNDTPFACLQNKLAKSKNHSTVWIPHSTIKIHEVDSAIPNSEVFYNDRLLWEQNAIDFINDNANSYIGGIGNFIKKHLIEEYSLKKSKIIDVYNGELIDEKFNNLFNKENDEYFKKISNDKPIMLSFARAEEYKNLQSTMYLGSKLNITTIVIAQSYYKEQPILDEYRELAKETNTKLFIDPPFDFAKYILHNFTNDIILLVPSKKEIMGLVINEIRKLRKDNILVVANDIDGLNEQIKDGYDGLLVDLSNLEDSKKKIEKYFNKEKMSLLCSNGYDRLKKDYNFEKNCGKFLNDLGVLYNE